MGFEVKLRSFLWKVRAEQLFLLCNAPFLKTEVLRSSFGRHLKFFLPQAF